MTRTTRELFKQILRLPAIGRAVLLEEIYRSLGHPDDVELTRVWAREAEERIDAYDHGQLSGRDYELVKESLQKR